MLLHIRLDLLEGQEGLKSMQFDFATWLQSVDNLSNGILVNSLLKETSEIRLSQATFDSIQPELCDVLRVLACGRFVFQQFTTYETHLL